MKDIRLDEGAAALLQRLHAAGYQAFVVGGCVRDSLLGLCPQDWDLCTSALPGQIMELFGAENCIPTGLQHGTVTIKQGGRLYETTTFRTEGSYTDGRHPDRVQFVPKVEEDLARRDLTINAIAYNRQRGLVDPFGGQEDLAHRIIRAVGDPATRFEEDALRILRLYRFGARFGFAIEEKTDAAAKALCSRLDCVSVERIQEELAKLLVAPRPGGYLVPEVMAAILPELSGQALAKAAPVVDACPSGKAALPVRLAALLESLGEEGVRRTLRRLRCSNACVEQTAVLVRENREFARWGTLAAPEQKLWLRKLLGRQDLETVEGLAALCAAKEPENQPRYRQLLQTARAVEEAGLCCRIAQLAVNGRDLMAAGIPAGPALRSTLERLLEQVIREQLPNEKEPLLAAAVQSAAT